MVEIFLHQSMLPPPVPFQKLNALNVNSPPTVLSPRETCKGTEKVIEDREKHFKLKSYTRLTQYIVIPYISDYREGKRTQRKSNY